MKNDKHNKNCNWFLSVVSLMLLLTMLFVPSTVSAANNINDMIYEAIYLAKIDEQDKCDMYTDLSSISIGNPIQAYTIKNGETTEISAQYIPIFTSNELNSLAIVTFKNGDINCVELTDELIDELISFKDQKIALIFDNDSTFILCKNEIKMIMSYKNEIVVDPQKEAEYKDDISYLQLESIRDIKTDRIIPASKFEMSDDKKDKLNSTCIDSSSLSLESISGIMSRVTYPTSKYLDVTIVSQHNLPICWAAAVASIGNYLTSGTDHDAEYVSNYIYGCNQGGNTYAALLALQGIYGLDGVDNYFSPSFNTIKNAIYSSYPMYVRLYGSSSSGSVNHALTFIGYYDYSSGSYDGKIRYNDSNATNYKSFTFVSSGTYALAYNGVTCYIDEFVDLY